MGDIVERIRNGIMDGWSADYPCLDGIIAEEAATEIERLRILLLNPTDAMIEAGFDAGNLGDGEWQYADPEKTWRAMAARALEE